MACITHAILPAGDNPKSGKDWVIDRQALRKIVRPILHSVWPTLEAALNDPAAALARSSLTRMTSSEVTNHLSVHTLLALALGDLDPLTLANEWRAGLKLNCVVADDAATAIDRFHARLLQEQMFGPFANPATAAGYLQSIGWTNAILGVRPAGITGPVTWMNLSSFGKQPGSFTGSDVLANWEIEYRPIGHLWLAAQGRIPVKANTPDNWAMRRAAAHALLTKSTRPSAAAQNSTTPTTNASTKDKANMTIHPNNPATTTPVSFTIDENFRLPLNAMLTAAKLPAIEALLADVSLKQKALDTAAQLASDMQARDAEIAKLKANSVGGGITLKIDASLTSPQQAQGGWPAYSIKTDKAADIFKVGSSARKAFDFDVPVFVWDAPCPEVPSVDDTYIFRPQVLISVLYALVTGENLWLSGHTGTGKSTLVEQVCARLGWPMARINLDSEITRLDLMGRDVITQTNGQTVTHFEEGILPRALQRPMVLLLDECDFGRPDVMYCLQRVNEGTGVTLTEDGGRHIKPHPLFRVMATANTLGQGDDTGLYQGARIQSAAFLDRFTVWATVDPLSRDDVSSLIQRRVSGLDKNETNRIAQYVTEHGVAFRERQVGTPVSPRAAIAIARSFATYSALMPADRAREKALAQAVIDRAPETDRKVLVGIADRVWK